MNSTASDYSLAELMICANAAIYAEDGEVLVTGIGVLQRLAGSLAMKTCNTEIMMTDSEAWLLEEPNPLGARGDDFVQRNENWMGFSRIFDNVWNTFFKPTKPSSFCGALGWHNSSYAIYCTDYESSGNSSICND